MARTQSFTNTDVDLDYWIAIVETLDNVALLRSHRRGVVLERH